MNFSIHNNSNYVQETITNYEVFLSVMWSVKAHSCFYSLYVNKYDKKGA